MKLLFVSDVSIRNVIGGAERVLFEQTTRLAKRGHLVHVLTRKLPEHAINDEIIEGVHEWRYLVDTSSNLLFFLSTLGNAYKRFEWLQKEYAFDCINSHQPFSAWAVRRSPSCEGLPFFYTCHSLSFEEYLTRHQKPSGLQKKGAYAFNLYMRKWIEKRVLDKSRHIIVLSAFTRKKLISQYRLPEDKISVVPGGADMEHFRPLGDKKKIRERLGLPVDGTMLITIRNLVPRMGLENLVRAMEDIVRTVPHLHLVIGGNGPLKESLMALVRTLRLESCIQFVGFVPEDLLPTYIGAADAFILPSSALEGFGLVTVEALACGIPVLGTPIGGTLEILQALDPSFLFDDHSPAAIARRIIENVLFWKREPAHYGNLCLLCRRYAEQNYAWQINIEATEKLLCNS